MLEGNRDEVLRVLENSLTGDDAAWLRAQAALMDQERYDLLNHLMNGEDSKFAALAAQIVRREDDFTRQLNEPPDYKFWKQPSWEGKWRKMQPFRLWLATGLLLFFLSLIGVSLNTKNQIQQESLVASIKFTQTAAAAFNQTIAIYAAGKLEILETEQPTTRLVTFGEMNNATPMAATPAVGASFTAIHFRFFCSLALCATPPEAEIRLLMSDGTEIGYQDSASPYFIGEPPIQRIAQGRSTDFWYVFEVPNGIMPDAVLVLTEDGEIPQFINWTSQ